MLETIRNLALYGGTDRESYNAVTDKIQEYNCFIAFIFASVATLLISIMLILSQSQEGFSGSKYVYIWGIIFSVVQIGISLMGRKIPQLSYVSVYMAISVFLLYGIAIGTLTRPDEQTVTFMVMMIFVPLIFIDRPVRMALSLIFYIIVFIIMACHTKSGSTLSVDITDAIIFGILAIVSETVVNRAKIRGYVLEYRLHIMSETDQLTGLNNRNCYEMHIPQYSSQYNDSVCCVYIDVNGLHELNNTQGHRSGDEMLAFIADAVRKQFGQKDVYRVGGDEYVAFAMDIPEEEINRRLEAMRKSITDKGYHAAIGYTFSGEKEADISGLIMSAETKMYKDKAEYYKVRDRRGR
ncbi:MAG: diguanylate cyclase [Lachnospiraceae bacterium]|nr:diguanylate cyclase [Lachnospiraceae bacterium]